jgi:hypothetical protein
MTICVFCGRDEPLTREHVLGAWLSGIGLDPAPGHHRAGWLNRLARDFGVARPFEQTVREVCAGCNNGWMSRLEDVARRVLGPLIMGNAGVIEPGDSGAIAAWTHKTALVAMLVSSEQDRAAGYGLPSSEYRELYAHRDALVPPAGTQFWIGRYRGVPSDGAPAAIQQVTPLLVYLERQPEPRLPNAYLMTILLGSLVIQGVRFTTRASKVELSTRQALPRLWPNSGRLHWPAGAAIDEGSLFGFCGGKDLLATAPVVVEPWRHATDLDESRRVGSMIELDTLCGKHVVYYPAVIAHLAMSGTFHAFVTSCECGTAYLVETRPDGAHFKAAGSGADVESRYNLLAGDKLSITDAGGTFACKRLAGSTALGGHH